MIRTPEWAETPDATIIDLAARRRTEEADRPTDQQDSPEPLMRRLVGVALRDERTRQRRTLKEVSEEARISMQYLSEIERGRKEASSEVLATVCHALDLHLIDLVGRIHQGLVTESRHVVRPAPMNPQLLAA